MNSTGSILVIVTIIVLGCLFSVIWRMATRITMRRPDHSEERKTVEFVSTVCVEEFRQTQLIGGRIVFTENDENCIEFRSTANDLPDLIYNFCGSTKLIAELRDRLREYLNQSEFAAIKRSDKPLG